MATPVRNTGATRAVLELRRGLGDALEERFELGVVRKDLERDLIEATPCSVAEVLQGFLHRPPF
jgi:hypothetical protein